MKLPWMFKFYLKHYQYKNECLLYSPKLVVKKVHVIFQNGELVILAYSNSEIDASDMKKKRNH